MSLNARAIALQGIGYPSGALAAQGLAVFDAQIGEPVGFAGGFPVIWAEIMRDGLPDYRRPAVAVVAIAVRSRSSWVEVPDIAIIPPVVVPVANKPRAKVSRKASTVRPTVPVVAPAPAAAAVVPQEVVAIAPIAITVHLAGGAKVQFLPDYESRGGAVLDIKAGGLVQFLDRLPEIRAHQQRVLLALLQAGAL